MTLRSALLTLLTICWSLPTAASEKPPAAVAPSAETTAGNPEGVADAWFERGQQFYRNQQFLQAASAFERAFALVPHGATAYNAAVAWAASGQDPRAANAYRAALKLGKLRKQDQAHALDELSLLRSSLGHLSVSCGGDARLTVGGVSFATCPSKTFVAPGKVAVSATRKNGTRLTRVVQIEAGKALRVRVIPSSSPEPQAPMPPSPQETAFPWHTVVLGASGAAATAGLVLGQVGLDARNQFDNTDSLDVAARERALSFRNYANAAWLGAAAFGITGVILLLNHGSDDAPKNPTRSALALGIQSVHYKVEF